MPAPTRFHGRPPATPDTAAAPRPGLRALRALSGLARLYRSAGTAAGQRASDRRPDWIDALECEANAMTAAAGAAAADRRAR